MRVRLRLSYPIFCFVLTKSKGLYEEPFFSIYLRMMTWKRVRQFELGLGRHWLIYPKPIPGGLGTL